MTQQPLFTSRAPKVGPQDVDVLIRALQTSPQMWTTGRELQRAYGWNERKCRAIAEASGGLVIGSQSGYALVRQLSQMDYEAAVAPQLKALRTQKARLAASDRVFYGSRHQRPEAA